jgi:dihydrofolate synthase / folylpolyglutamate synthase
MSNKIFLEKLEKFTSNYPRVIDLSLDRVNRLLFKLNNPHLKLPPVIHVAGTNGKGSTIAFLSKVLMCAGKKVHIYTSPHLIEVTERFIIRNNRISYKKLFETLDYCLKINNDDPITQFELLTCIAFLLMSRSKADVAIIETGLGGRLDATNVVQKPLLNIITSISIDHTEFLGNTLELIANEKAGIIKNNTLCISAPQNPVVEKIIVNKCAEKNSKLIVCNKTTSSKETKDGFKIKGLDNNLYTFPLPSLNGRHQIINAVLAVTSLIACPQLDIGIQSITEGISSTKWQGRLEKLNKGKIKKTISSSIEVWVDGGHNIAGAETIKKWVKDEKVKNIILVCGFLKNKDVKKILSILKNIINYIVFVPLQNTKNSYSVSELKSIAKILDLKFYFKNSVKEALYSDLIIPNSKVLIFGSLYLVGEVLRLDKN